MRPQNKRPHRLCGEPLCFEAVLQRLFTAYGLTMTWEQYVLVGSTVRSYLSWLCDTGRLEALFENNLLLWRKNKDRVRKSKKQSAASCKAHGALFCGAGKSRVSSS